MAENGKGQGFVNISEGIGNIFNGLFGNDGAADELAVIFNKNGGYTYVDPNLYAQQQQRASANNMLYIIIAIGLVIGLFFMFKK